MTTDDGVADLLFLWESAKIKPSVESLCHERPDLIPRIKREIAIIQKFNQDFEEEPSELPSGPPVAPIIPRHTVGAYIGAGGMGDVWEATDVNLNRTVALKVLKIADTGEQTAIATQRFEREMRLAASLLHPGIATIFSGDLLPNVSGENAGTARSCYYTMELIRGHMLDEYVRNKSLSVIAVLELFLEICNAAAYAHRKSIVHRDLKPANIMVDADGHSKILDFGIARDIRENQSRFTAKFGGTPDYMGPAQRHGEEASPRMDVHALGCILFDLLCIASPNPKDLEDRMPSFQRVISPEMIHKNILHAPQALISIICRTQQTDNEPAFQDASNLADAVREYLKDTEKPVTSIPAKHLFPRRKFIFAVAAVVLVVIAIGAIFVIHSSHTERQPISPILPSSSVPDPPEEPKSFLYMQVYSKYEGDGVVSYLNPVPATSLTTNATEITPNPNLPVKIQAKLDVKGNAILTASGLQWAAKDFSDVSVMPSNSEFTPSDTPLPITTDFKQIYVCFKGTDEKNHYLILRVRYGN